MTRRKKKNLQPPQQPPIYPFGPTSSSSTQMPMPSTAQQQQSAGNPQPQPLNSSMSQQPLLKQPPTPMTHSTNCSGTFQAQAAYPSTPPLNMINHAVPPPLLSVPPPPMFMPQIFQQHQMPPQPPSAMDSLAFQLMMPMPAFPQISAAAAQQFGNAAVFAATMAANIRNQEMALHIQRQQLHQFVLSQNLPLVPLFWPFAPPPLPPMAHIHQHQYTTNNGGSTTATWEEGWTGHPVPEPEEDLLNNQQRNGAREDDAEEERTAADVQLSGTGKQKPATSTTAGWPPKAPPRRVLLISEPRGGTVEMPNAQEARDGQGQQRQRRRSFFSPPMEEVLEKVVMTDGNVPMPHSGNIADVAFTEFGVVGSPEVPAEADNREREATEIGAVQQEDGAAEVGAVQQEDEAADAINDFLGPPAANVIGIGNENDVIATHMVPEAILIDFTTDVDDPIPQQLNHRHSFLSEPKALYLPYQYHHRDQFQEQDIDDEQTPPPLMPSLFQQQVAAMLQQDDGKQDDQSQQQPIPPLFSQPQMQQQQPPPFPFEPTTVDFQQPELTEQEEFLLRMEQSTAAYTTPPRAKRMLRIQSPPDTTLFGASPNSTSPEPEQQNLQNDEQQNSKQTSPASQQQKGAADEDEEVSSDEKNQTRTKGEEAALSSSQTRQNNTAASSASSAAGNDAKADEQRQQEVSNNNNEENETESGEQQQQSTQQQQMLGNKKRLFLVATILAQRSTHGFVRLSSNQLPGPLDMIIDSECLLNRMMMEKEQQQQQAAGQQNQEPLKVAIWCAPRRFPLEGCAWKVVFVPRRRRRQNVENGGGDEGGEPGTSGQNDQATTSTAFFASTA